MIFNGDIVGTQYLYRSHYNHGQNVWHMNKMTNSSEKRSNLKQWMETHWPYMQSFQDYVVVNQSLFKGDFWQLIDYSEIFYKLSADERIRSEFQWQPLSVVLKWYMKDDSQQMMGIKKTHSKMDRTLTLGYAANRLVRQIDKIEDKDPNQRVLKQYVDVY